MLSNLWGRITGKDKRLRYPDQQAVFLGRVGNYTVVFPYGLYGDLPADTLLKEIAPGVAVPVTVERPGDTEQGEPVFFHPATNTRMILRNNGDLDITTTEASGKVNVDTVQANITASESVTVDTPITTFTGDVQINGKLNVDEDITGLANIIATALLQGANISIINGSGTSTVDGSVTFVKDITITTKPFLPHTHPQGSDSDGDAEQDTGGVM
jgi:hypothetical protein